MRPANALPWSSTQSSTDGAAGTAGCVDPRASTCNPAELARSVKKQRGKRKKNLTPGLRRQEFSEVRKIVEENKRQRESSCTAGVAHRIRRRPECRHPRKMGDRRLRAALARPSSRHGRHLDDECSKVRRNGVSECAHARQVDTLPARRRARCATSARGSGGIVGSRDYKSCSENPDESESAWRRSRSTWSMVALYQAASGHCEAQVEQRPSASQRPPCSLAKSQWLGWRGAPRAGNVSQRRPSGDWRKARAAVSRTFAWFKNEFGQTPV